jgi:metal-sulfur cluster biosynthetic enzyme
VTSTNGLIYAIELADDGAVKVEMTLTHPPAPRHRSCGHGGGGDPPIARRFGCEVEIVWDPPWDQSRMSEDARLALNMY